MQRYLKQAIPHIAGLHSPYVVHSTCLCENDEAHSDHCHIVTLSAAWHFRPVLDRLTDDVKAAKTVELKKPVRVGRR